MPQDMPPVGGYEPVQYKRNLPARGFRPATYLAIMGGIMAYGFYRVGQGIREHKYVHCFPLPPRPNHYCGWREDCRGENGAIEGRCEDVWLVC